MASKKSTTKIEYIDHKELGRQIQAVFMMVGTLEHLAPDDNYLVQGLLNEIGARLELIEGAASRCRLNAPQEYTQLPH